MSVMNLEKERERFEAWAASEDVVHLDGPLGKLLESCWQAAKSEAQADVRELEEVLERTKDLAEFWINRENRSQFSEEQHRLWVSLGHQSNAMKAANAILAKHKGAHGV